MKDHKPNFCNKPTSRLINPTKPEIGKISKQILAKVVKIAREESQLKQWKNTDSVIMWFNNIQDKKRFTFINFDIVDFYPSISEELLLKSINFAKKYTSISDDEIQVILQSRKSFLFDKNQPWKKTSNPRFDVAMGSCDIVGLYLLSCLKPLNINIGLYRDAALDVLKMTPRQVDLMKKEIC